LRRSGLCGWVDAPVNTQYLECHTTIEMSPAFSTIEVSPGCGFTMPRKRLVFSSPASIVSKDDGQLAVVDEIVEGSGMGVRGKGVRGKGRWSGVHPWAETRR
jgi:hypothetical protein